MSAKSCRALLFAACMALPLIAHAEDKKAQKDAEFVQLGDFTINVPNPNHHREYLVLTITVETPVGTAEKLQEISPRIQDAVLRKLMAMSQEGELKPNETDPLVIKDALFDAISKVKPNGVKEVLITRILYS